MASISDKGLAFIRAQEGLRLSPYLDQVGIRTIGYGHARWTGGDITEAQAEALLQDDLRPCLACIDQRVMVPITQPMVDALCSLIFNCGPGALVNSDLGRNLNAGNYQEAGDGFLDWCHGIVNGEKVVLPVLLARRQAERVMFLSELPPEPDA
jgi:lysozyme